MTLTEKFTPALLFEIFTGATKSAGSVREAKGEAIAKAHYLNSVNDVRETLETELPGPQRNMVRYLDI